MIEKMTRYSFILLKKSDEGFTETLQELGLMDITRSSRPVDEESAAMLAEAESLKKAISDIEEDRFTRDPRYNALIAQENLLQKQYVSALPWGQFDPAALEGLSAHGMKARFYCVASKKFDPAWGEIQPLQTIAEQDGNLYFVTLGPEAAYEFPIPECPAPAAPAPLLESRLKETAAALQERRTVLESEKDNLPSMRDKLAGTLEALDRRLALAASQTAAEGALTVMEGFAPTKDDARVQAALDSMDVVYYCEKANSSDNPPIKLRNHRFSKLFEGITGMYGMPVYNEFDPTPVLSIFFMLFFAMCMGDAGYGLILILFGIAVNKKWVRIDMFKNIGTLISVLGVATFFVGLMLGTFFGMSLQDASWYPDMLKKFIISGTIAGYSAQMVLALAIGVLHICLAMIIKTALYTAQSGVRNNLSTWGWTLLIVGSVVTLSLAALLHLDAGTTKIIIIAIGILSARGIFIFNRPGKNPLANIGVGLWNTYQMVTGLLGDVLSYIRLYALGLAGGMLGDSFNKLGLMVLGDNPLWQWVPFVLILLLGHTLNILMSCLGAFVHPLRLTFVEYFKNSGFEGTGRAYKPLAKTNK